MPRRSDIRRILIVGSGPTHIIIIKIRAITMTIEKNILFLLLFPALIRDWRANWGQGDFPFLFVQLANFTAAQPER